MKALPAGSDHPAVSPEASRNHARILPLNVQRIKNLRNIKEFKDSKDQSWNSRMFLKFDLNPSVWFGKF